MKNIFKLIVSIFGLILVVSCQTENMETEKAIINDSAQLRVTIKSWNHLKNDTENLKERVQPYFKKNELNRFAESETYGFYIEEDDVQVIEQEDYTTYTFVAFRNSQESNTLENYVYKEYSNGNYEQYLLKYYYTINENGERVYDSSVLEVEYIEDEGLVQNRVGCVPEFIEVENIYVCTYNDRCTGKWKHEIGDDQCTCTDSPDTCDPAGSTSCGYETVWNYIGCQGSSDSTTTDNGNEPGEPDNNGSTTTDPNNNNNTGEETPALPLEPTVRENVLECLNGDTLSLNGQNIFIDPEIFNQLDLTRSEWISINDYLEINACSDQARQQIIDDLLEVFDEQIFLDDAFVNNECLKGIYDDMGKASSFNNYLKNFDGDFSVAHLRFNYDVNFEINYDESHHNALAVTEGPQNYLINIVFNGDTNLAASTHGKPKLILALAFMHEMIHAEIYRKLLSVGQQPNLQYAQWYAQDVDIWYDFLVNLSNSFPGLYDYYMRLKWDVPPGQEAEDVQHNLMAQHYVDTIVSGLAEYDNNQHSTETYEALAWIGLYNTRAWDNLTPEQQQILVNNRTNYENSVNEICD